MNIKKNLLLLILGLIIMGCSEKDSPKVLKVEKIEISKSTLELVEGSSYQLEAKVFPEIPDINMIWKSSDESIVSVMNNGIITALGIGEAEILASVGDIVSKCTIKVVKKHIPVKSVSIEKSLTLKVDEEYDLNIKILPENASNKSYKLSFSDEDVIFTDGEFSIMAVKAGKCVITVTTADGNKSANCDVTVVSKDDEFSCIDKAGRKYQTIQIGNQVWMAENLAYIDSELLNNGAYVYNYSGDDVKEAMSTENYKKFGVLYSYSSIESCIPKGWHIPSDEEWQELETYIGLSDKEISSYGSRGSKSYALMSKEDWQDLSFEATNETKFSAKPAGLRSSSGYFNQIFLRTVFWGGISEDGSIIGRALFNSSTKINRSKANPKSAYSVRLIKD